MTSSSTIHPRLRALESFSLRLGFELQAELARADAIDVLEQIPVCIPQQQQQQQAQNSMQNDSSHTHSKSDNNDKDSVESVNTDSTQMQE